MISKQEEDASVAAMAATYLGSRARLLESLRDDFDKSIFGTPTAPASRQALLDTYKPDLGISLGLPWREHYLDFMIKDLYNKHFGYHVLTKELMDALVPHLQPFAKKNIVEVMAGSGWLAAHLQHRGIPIRATDNWSWGKDHTADTYAWKNTCHTCVYQQDAAYAAAYADCVVMGWPYLEDSCEKVLFSMQSGSTLFVQGEDHGCTGTGVFWDTLEQWGMEELDDVNAVHITFEGLHDRWYKAVKP